MMKKTAVIALLLLWAGAPLWAQGDHQKGVSYYQQGQYQKSIDEFAAIVKEHADYQFGHRMLGLSYLKLKNYSRAVDAFREAVRLKSDDLTSYQGLALAYFNAGRYQEVVPTLSRAESLATSPKDKYQLYQTRGAAAFNLKDYARAVSDLEKAVAIQRGNSEDALQLGIAYYHLKQYSKAASYLKQAQSAHGSEASQYLSRLGYRSALDAFDSKNYQAAADQMRSYVESNPNDGEAWFNLGLALLFVPNLKASEEAFKRSAAITPDNSETFNRLGFVYEKQKQYSKALDAYKKAYQLSRESAIKESIDRIQLRLKQGA